MKKIIYFLPIVLLVSCAKHKKTSSINEGNYSCECETKTEFIDNCRIDSTSATQIIVAPDRNSANENCKALNSTGQNTETKTTRSCELSE